MSLNDRIRLKSKRISEKRPTRYESNSQPASRSGGQTLDHSMALPATEEGVKGPKSNRERLRSEEESQISGAIGRRPEKAVLSGRW